MKKLLVMLMLLPMFAMAQEAVIPTVHVTTAKWSVKSVCPWLNRFQDVRWQWNEDTKTMKLIVEFKKKELRQFWADPVPNTGEVVIGKKFEWLGLDADGSAEIKITTYFGPEEMK